jgi:predicted transcriptional regulator
MALTEVVAEKAPGSLDGLARITGKAKSNLSRTLRTMEGYGLVRLERGERGRITPEVKATSLDDTACILKQPLTMNISEMLGLPPCAFCRVLAM